MAFNEQTTFIQRSTNLVVDVLTTKIALHLPVIEVNAAEQLVTSDTTRSLEGVVTVIVFLETGRVNNDSNDVIAIVEVGGVESPSIVRQVNSPTTRVLVGALVRTEEFGVEPCAISEIEATGRDA